MAVYHPPQPAPRDAIQFTGTTANILDVMTFIEAGRGTTEVSIRAELDPADSRMTFRLAEARVHLRPGEWIERTPDGLRFSSTLAASGPAE